MHAGGMPVDEQTKLLVYARIIHAIYDIAPYADGETPVPFLYWEDGLSAATAVIKRSVIVFVAFLIFVFDHVLVLENLLHHVNNNRPLYYCCCAGFVTSSLLLEASAKNDVM
jgi:hypothetical protein